MVITASFAQSKTFEFEGIFWNKPAKPNDEL